MRALFQSLTDSLEMTRPLSDYGLDAGSLTASQIHALNMRLSSGSWPFANWASFQYEARVTLDPSPQVQLRLTQLGRFGLRLSFGIAVLIAVLSLVSPFFFVAGVIACGGPYLRLALVKRQIARILAQTKTPPEGEVSTSSPH